MSTHTVIRAPLALVVAVAALLALAPPASAQEQEVTRLQGGVTAVLSAVAWSQASFAAGSAPDVLIARNDVFADSLASGPVQGLLNAPLLLTESAVLSPETAAEITRLGARNAFILGGDAAVSPTVVTELEALGLSTERIAGPTRLHTAVAIQQRFFPNTTAVNISRAFGGADGDETQAFVDALALGPFSAATNIPVLLTDPNQLSEPTAQALQALPVSHANIVGGEAAVSISVRDQVATAIDDGDGETPESVERIAGENRFATAIALNEQLFYATAADAPRILLVEGQDDLSWTSGFPAAVQAGNGAVTVLANGDSLPPETQSYIAGSNRPLVCGPGVSTAACDAAVAAVFS